MESSVSLVSKSLLDLTAEDNFEDLIDEEIIDFIFLLVARPTVSDCPPNTTVTQTQKKKVLLISYPSTHGTTAPSENLFGDKNEHASTTGVESPKMKVSSSLSSLSYPLLVSSYTSISATTPPLRNLLGNKN